MALPGTGIRPGPIRPPSEPTDRLLADFNSVLQTLEIPLEISNLSLATPTLLLTVLEAILETRIVDVSTAWRAQAGEDPTTRTRIVQVLVRAIAEVVEGISKRVPASGRFRVDGLNIGGIAQGQREDVALVLNILLEIASALDVAARRKERSETRSPRVKPSKVALASATETRTADKLFSPRPLRRPPSAPPAPPSHAPEIGDDQPERTRRTAPATRAPSTALSESALEPRSPSPPLAGPKTPTRRQRPPTSFLAELARAQLPPGADGMRSLAGTGVGSPEGRSRSPPVSPRKSIVEVMRSLERRERSPQKRRVAEVPEARPWSPALLSESQRSPKAPHCDEPSPKPDTYSLQRSRNDVALALGDSSSRTSESSSSELSSSETARGSSPPSAAATPTLVTRIRAPPCTCGSLEAARVSRPWAVDSRPAPSAPKQEGVAETATKQEGVAETATIPARRIQVRRVDLSASDDNGGYLSVHSSTDVETPPPGVSLSVRLSTPRRDPTDTAADPNVLPETPSPYTLLLLAERDRLREKLKLLERRERDRREATKAAAAAAAAMADAVPSKSGIAAHSPGIGTSTSEASRAVPIPG